MGTSMVAFYGRARMLGVFAAALAGAGALALAWSATVSTARADEPAFASIARPVEASASIAVEARTWTEVRSDATRLLGRRVKFVVQFHGRVERWKSYLSRFSPRSYSAFQFWADEQMPFRAEDYETPFARVFARRGTGAEEVLAQASRYTRFEIEGTVHELFVGEPWIEAESVRALPEALTEGSVIHGGRALGLMEEGLWNLAESQLSIALQARVPAGAREELERLRQICRENSGSATRASSRPWTGPAPNVRLPNRRRSTDDD